MRLAILGNGCYFGEEEVIDGEEKRRSRASVRSFGAEIFAISKELLLNNLKLYKCLDVLKLIVDEKRKVYSSRT